MDPTATALQTALDVQDACNLSGVIHAWSRHLARIPRQDELSRSIFNTLMLSKTCSLMAGIDDPVSLIGFDQAQDDARRIISGKYATHEIMPDGTSGSFSRPIRCF